jgi:hypothetical protein
MNVIVGVESRRLMCCTSLKFLVVRGLRIQIQCSYRLKEGLDGVHTMSQHECVVTQNDRDPGRAWLKQGVYKRVKIAGKEWQPQCEEKKNG